MSKMEQIETQRSKYKKDEEKKKHIMTLYKQMWNVKVKNRDMPVKTLENLLSKKASHKQQRRAAVKIQTAVRGMIARLNYKKIVDRRNEAARYLQRIWKRYRMISMVPKAWRKFKYNKIT